MNTPKYCCEVAYDPTLFTYTVIITDKQHNKVERKITQLDLDIEFHKLITKNFKEGIKELQAKKREQHQEMVIEVCKAEMKRSNTND